MKEHWETKCDFIFSKAHFLDISGIKESILIKKLPKSQFRSPGVLKAVALKYPKKFYKKSPKIPQNPHFYPKNTNFFLENFTLKK